MPTTFRSDSDSDFGCLEEFLKEGQFGTLHDESQHLAQQDLAFLQAVIDATADKMAWISDSVRQSIRKQEDVQLPTRYDSPLQFRILEGLVSKVKSAARDLGLSTEEFPHFACIPTGRVNASAVSLPGSSRPFLLFDSQLFLYCHLFAKTFARCLPILGREGMLSFSTELPEVKRRLESAPDIVEHLEDLLAAYTSTGAPSNSKPYPLESDYLQLVTILREGMELFVVAHEIGHVYAGHLSDLLKGLGLNAVSSEAWSSSHRQEHEADILGLALTLRASGYDAALAYVGVELFFVSLDMADRYAYAARQGNDDLFQTSPSSTHPSNEDRREALRIALVQFVSPIEQAESAKAMASNYEAIAKHLWAALKTANPSFKRTGLRPAA